MLHSLGIAIIYAGTYSLCSSSRVDFWVIFLAVFPFVCAIFGMLYTPSFLLDGAQAQLCAIILAFLCYLFCGADPSFKAYAPTRPFLRRAATLPFPTRMHPA